MELEKVCLSRSEPHLGLTEPGDIPIHPRLQPCGRAGGERGAVFWRWRESLQVPSPNTTRGSQSAISGTRVSRISIGSQTKRISE